MSLLRHENECVCVCVVSTNRRHILSPAPALAGIGSSSPWLQRNYPLFIRSSATLVVDSAWFCLYVIWLLHMHLYTSSLILDHIRCVRLPPFQLFSVEHSHWSGKLPSKDTHVLPPLPCSSIHLPNIFLGCCNKHPEIFSLALKIKASVSAVLFRSTISGKNHETGWGAQLSANALRKLG